MHSYLRGIGFKKLRQTRQLKEILGRLDFPGNQVFVAKVENTPYMEIRIFTSDSTGICIYGSQNENGNLEIEGYFPFLESHHFMEKDDLLVDYHIDGSSFSAWADDVRLGVSLIFHLANPGEYFLKQGVLGTDKREFNLSLSGICKEGTVLLPLTQDKVEQEKNKRLSQERTRLLEAVKTGSQDAMESLTLDDMDLYSMISKRIQDEDVFSIVNSYFMPYGMECELYSILGEIKACEWEENKLSQERFCKMTIEVNEVFLEVCIHSDDLIGEPKVGRRFKAVLWLQGYIKGIK